MSSELECLKVSKVAFTIFSVNERFDLKETKASKETAEACYSMPIIKELPRKMLKTTVKVTFNTEDRTVESMQRLSQFNSLDVILVIYCAFYIFDIKCSNLKVF